MEFLTIMQEAKRGLVPEYRLRQMLKQGKLPGYFAGTRFYIHHEMLVKQLDEECLRNMGGQVKQ